MCNKKSQASSPQRYEKLLNQYVDQLASEAQKARRARESVILSREGSVNDTTSKTYTKQETLDIFFAVVFICERSKIILGMDGNDY